jgi:hypothetical protein
MRVFALLALSLPLAAQVDPRLETGFRTINAARLRTELTFLSSPGLDGRLSLQPGSEVAIDWIAAEFEKAGLKPIGKSFRQQVPLIDYKTDRAATGVLVKGTLYPGNVSFTQDVSINAPVVFAGFGITAPELNYDDYAGIDAKGKIVVVFNGEPQDEDEKSIFNGKGATRYRNNIAKAMIAAQHGAIALVVAPSPNRKRQDRAPGQFPAPSATPLARRSIQVLAEGGSPIPIATLNEAGLTALFAGAPKSASEAQAAIDSTLKAASMPLPTAAEVRLVTTERKRAASANVVGMIEGSDPTLKNETVIFSAHSDHDGPAPDGGYFPGADDDGSGTVGIVELARAFAANPTKPKRTVVFAVFAAEERGLLGSYYYAARPLRPLDTTRAVINFDMIGRNEEHIPSTKGVIEIAPDTSNELNLVGTKYSPDYKKAVENWNEFVGLRLSYKWDDESTQNVFFRSDQYPFIQRGVPAMWWFTGFHPDYHKVTDTPDRINYTKMEKILRLAYLTGFAFADTATPPKFRAAAN